MELIELCKELIRIESYDGEEEILGYIESLLKNAKIHKIKSEGSWSLLALKGNYQGKPLLCGHCDTVPPTNQWKRNPFKPVIEEGKLYGLGASDMKCGLAVVLHTFMNSENCALLITTGEETGDFTGMKSFSESKFANQFKHAIIADTSDMSVVVEQSGLASIDIIIESEQRHTQNFYSGTHPVNEAAELIHKMNQNFNTEGKESKLGNKPILAFNTIRAREKRNIIPGKCTIQVDRRVSPLESLEEVEKFYKKHLKEFKWKKRFWVESVQRLEDEFVDSIISAGKKIGRDINPSTSMGVSEMLFLRRKGIKAVTIGPGLKPQAHSPDEYVLIQNVLDYQKLLDLIMNG